MSEWTPGPLTIKEYRVRFTNIPGGPDNEAVFIELEDEKGNGLGTGEWVDDGDSVLLVLPVADAALYEALKYYAEPSNWTKYASELMEPEGMYGDDPPAYMREIELHEPLVLEADEPGYTFAQAALALANGDDHEPRDS